MQEEDFEVLKWHDALLSSAADSAYLHLDIRHPEFFNGAVDERYNSLRQITASLHLWGGLERRTGCNAKELSQMRSWQGAQADHIIPVVFARRAIADVINTYSIPGPKAWSILYRAVNSIEFNVVLTTADFNRGRADCWGAKRESFVDHMGFSLVDVTRFTAFEASGVSFDDDKSVVFHSFLFMCSFIADGALNNRQGETGLSKGDRAFLVLFCLRLAVMIWSIFCMPVGQDIRARAVFSGAVKQDGAVISVPSLWDTLQEFLSRFEEGVLAVVAMNLSCNESRFNSKTSAILGTIEDVCKPELWCEPTGLLASIFPISSRPPAERLSSQLLDLLLRFLYNVKDAPGKMAQEGGFCGPTVEQTDVLIEACKKLKREALLWMPECGFMVMRVETPVGARAHDTCDLAILWLDGWATRSGGLQGAAPHSNPHDYVLLRKTVKNRAVETVLSCLDKLSPSASRKPPEGTKPQRRRSPTLGMISKCVDEAASDGQRDSYDPPGVALPRDAASRVGSWPLVLAAFSFALENHPSSMLHDIGADTAWRVAADLMLWLLQRQTMLASSAPSVSHLQKVHAMAKHLAEKSLQLSSAGHDVGPLAAAVHSAHRSLCNAVALHAKRTDEVYALPEIQDMRDLDTAHIAICEKSLPGPPKYRRHGSRKDGEIKDRLRINMGVTAGLMNPSISELMTDSLTAADVISGKGPSRLIRMQRYVLTFEQAMFNAADSGQWGGFGSEDKLETLKCKVETYRSVASTLRKELHATGAHEAAGMSTVVEMESREILVVWILACLTFEACKEAYPVLRGYHMALDAASLSWLSLSDRCANQAAVAVARYLECAIKEGQKGPLFHLERQESTLSFAAELVAALPSLKSVFDSFRDVELQAQREAWETICEKKRGLDVLRPRLQNMKSELKRVRDISELERSLAAHRKGIEKMEGKMTAEQLEADRKTAEEMQKEINRLRAGSRDHTDGWEARLRSKIRRIEWEIAERKRLPACYGQALPTDDTLARQVVFFHFMPRPLELLFWATVATQQLLMPRWELMSAELVAEFTKHVEEARPWVDVLTSHAQRVPGTACLGTVRDFAVVGVSSYDTAGELWVSSTVDNVDTFERSVELLELRPHGQVQLLWRGAHGGVYPLDRSEGKLAKGLDFFNPLHDSEAARQARIERFTVPVPGMDWAAQLARRSDLTSDPTRGNEGVTRVSSAPTWAPKSLESFAALGTLRAYPHIQLRALSAALSQDRLELGLSQVRLLVLQTLYELGELETGPERVRRTWWRELAVSGGIEHLCEIIRELQGRISLRNWKDCIVPVEIAAYLSEVSSVYGDGSQCDVVAETVRELARTIEVLCGQIEDRMALHELQALELHALASLPALTEQEAERMCILRCEIAKGLPKGDDVAVQVSAARAMSKSVYKISAHMAGKGGILTTVLEEMGIPIPAKETIQWLEFLQPGGTHRLGCWRTMWRSHAANGAMVRCFMDVVTGMILLDGLPVGMLPENVVQNPLYLRVFGRRRLRVVQQGGILYQTEGEIDGRSYEFWVTNTGVEILEIDSSQGLEQSDATLQLLRVPKYTDAGVAEASDGEESKQEIEKLGGWGADLPVLLKEGFSHWLARDHNGAPAAILLRPVEFLDRTIQCILAKGIDPANPEAWTCLSVPDALQGAHWRDILAAFSNVEGRQGSASLSTQPRCLVHLREPSQVMAVFGKFEDPVYIHCFRALCPAGPDDVLMVELPRYGLSFVGQDCGGDNGFRFVSGDFRTPDGEPMHLAPRQELLSSSPVYGTVYTLPGFTRFLVLESDTSPSGTQLRKVLVPGGAVSASSKGPSIKVPPRARDLRDALHVYVVQPRVGTLQARDIAGRLFLAALHTAVGSPFPEPLTGMNSFETATQLVRQSWTNRPLSDVEVEALEAIVQRWRDEECPPMLPLVVHELQSSAQAVSFLYEGCGTSRSFVLSPKDLERAKMSYEALLREALPWGGAPRQRLTELEEMRLFGCSRRWRWPTIGFESGSGARASDDDIGESELIRDLVEAGRAGEEVYKSTEKSLSAWATANTIASTSGEVPPFPLHAEDGTKLERQILDEQKESWEAHHMQRRRRLTPSSPTGDIGATVASCLSLCERALNDVRRKRVQLSEALLSELSPRGASRTIPEGARAVLRLAIVSGGAVSAPAELDLMRAAVEPKWLRRVNPLLSETAATAAWGAIIAWLQLVVLEDKLHRLVDLCCEGQPDAGAEENDGWSPGDDLSPVILREIDTVRKWDPRQHPEWLVFEAEGSLQIRPTQHQVVEQLLASDGGMVQLNMGEGKTRVLTPMLVLALTAKSRDGSPHSPLVRLTLLPELIRDAEAHLQSRLSASPSLSRRIIRLPFHRDVRLDAKRIAVLQTECLDQCVLAGGVLIMSREDRASLTLKGQEMRVEGDVLHSLVERIAKLDFGPDGSTVALRRMGRGKVQARDILDESDLMLSHTYQLIYTVGASAALPAGRVRWDLAQVALLALITDAKIKRHLSHMASKGTAVYADQSNGVTTFPVLRFIPTDGLDADWEVLKDMIVEFVLEKEHRRLGLRQLSSEAKRSVLSIVVDGTRDVRAEVDDIVSGMQDVGAKETVRAAIYALRGLLGFGVLRHCLERRHNVGFGQPGSERVQRLGKELAVPFVAANKPAHRSEFMHPDVVLTLTHLTYYMDGLDPSRVQQALRALFKMLPNQQRYEYETLVLGTCDAWVRAELSRLRLGKVSQIDPEKRQMAETLSDLIGRNPHLVNLWLSRVVFPRDMQHFAERLAVNSWHLAADSVRPIGFSGTKDLALLMPKPVRQLAPADQALLATDGRMLARLQEARCIWLSGQEQHAAQELLIEAAHGGYDAIIDSGALLCSLSSDSVYEGLDTLIDSQRHQGIYMFISDGTAEGGQWTMVERGGGYASSTERARVHTTEAFVVFFERECRGFDVKMRRDARALLTLGPGITKDKLMQAAGRMRGLDSGQEVDLVATEEVRRAASKHCRKNVEDIEVVDVLSWVMKNTMDANAGGVQEWARQGTEHCATATLERSTEADALIRPVRCDVEVLYSAGAERMSLGDVVKRACERQLAQMGMNPADMNTVASLRDVIRAATEYGEGYYAAVRAVEMQAGEEWQMELEEEREALLEQEVEATYEKCGPAAEEDLWTSSAGLKALACGDLAALRSDGHVMSISDLLWSLRRAESGILTGLPWEAGLLCTRNFATVSEGGVAETFLRTPRSALLFAGGDIVLVSEREEDDLLQVWIEGRVAPSSTSPVLFPIFDWLKSPLEHPPLCIRPAGGLGSPRNAAKASWDALWGTTMASSSPMQKRYELALSVGVFCGNVELDAVPPTIVQRFVSGHSRGVIDMLALRGRAHLLQGSCLEAAMDNVAAVAVSESNLSAQPATLEDLRAACKCDGVVSLGGREWNLEEGSDIEVPAGTHVLIRNGTLRAASGPVRLVVHRAARLTLECVQLDGFQVSARSAGVVLKNVTMRSPREAAGGAAGVSSGGKQHVATLAISGGDAGRAFLRIRGMESQGVGVHIGTATEVDVRGIKVRDVDAGLKDAILLAGRGTRGDIVGCNVHVSGVAHGIHVRDEARISMRETVVEATGSGSAVVCSSVQDTVVKNRGSSPFPASLSVHECRLKGSNALPALLVLRGGEVQVSESTIASMGGGACQCRGGGTLKLCKSVQLAAEHSVVWGSPGMQTLEELSAAITRYKSLCIDLKGGTLHAKLSISDRSVIIKDGDLISWGQGQRCGLAAGAGGTVELQNVNVMGTGIEVSGALGLYHSSVELGRTGGSGIVLSARSPGGRGGPYATLVSARVCGSQKEAAIKAGGEAEVSCTGGSVVCRGGGVVSVECDNLEGVTFDEETVLEFAESSSCYVNDVGALEAVLSRKGLHVVVIRDALTFGCSSWVSVKEGVRLVLCGGSLAWDRKDEGEMVGVGQMAQGLSVEREGILEMRGVRLDMRGGDGISVQGAMSLRHAAVEMSGARISCRGAKASIDIRRSSFGLAAGTVALSVSGGHAFARDSRCYALAAGTDVPDDDGATKRTFLVAKGGATAVVDRCPVLRGGVQVEGSEAILFDTEVSGVLGDGVSTLGGSLLSVWGGSVEGCGGAGVLCISGRAALTGVAVAGNKVGVVARSGGRVIVQGGRLGPNGMGVQERGGGEVVVKRNVRVQESPSFFA